MVIFLEQVKLLLVIVRYFYTRAALLILKQITYMEEPNEQTKSNHTYRSLANDLI